MFGSVRVLKRSRLSKVFQEERKDRFAREEVEGILWGGSEWGSDEALSIY